MTSAVNMDSLSGRRLPYSRRAVAPTNPTFYLCLKPSSYYERLILVLRLVFEESVVFSSGIRLSKEDLYTSQQTCARIPTILFLDSRF